MVSLTKSFLTSAHKISRKGGVVDFIDSVDKSSDKADFIA